MGPPEQQRGQPLLPKATRTSSSSGPRLDKLTSSSLFALPFSCDLRSREELLVLERRSCLGGCRTRGEKMGVGSQRQRQKSKIKELSREGSEGD